MEETVDDVLHGRALLSDVIGKLSRCFVSSMGGCCGYRARFSVRAPFSQSTGRVIGFVRFATDALLFTIVVTIKAWLSLQANTVDRGPRFCRQLKASLHSTALQ